MAKVEAKIELDDISKVNLIIPKDDKGEIIIRNFDHESIHPLVREMYVKKGYDNLPKSKDESDRMNAELKQQGLPPKYKHFNGLMSSCVEMEFFKENKKTLVKATVMPTWYLLGQAMRDVMKEAKQEGIEYSTRKINAMSTNHFNGSLIAPSKITGEYYLISQIKGNALGAGEIHTGLVAGNVDGAYLQYGDYALIQTMRNECSEELGMDLNELNPGSFAFLVNEKRSSQINLAAVATQVDLDAILGHYESMIIKKLEDNEEEIFNTYEMMMKGDLPKDAAIMKEYELILMDKLEVMGLATLPMKGIALTPIKDDGSLGLNDVVCYIPTKNGLITDKQNRGVRPYTQATINYFNAKKKNHKHVLEKAGF